MKTNKLIFLFSILLSMLATNTSAYDFAVKNADGVMIYYSYYGNDSKKTTVYVTYKDEDYNSYSGSVTIPEEITYNKKTLKVTSIGSNVFWKCTQLTSVTIPNSITSIGNYAFNGCSSLTSITIPNSVTRIGNYAFYGCKSLTTVKIPNSVKSIDCGAFGYCSSLKSITIPNGVTSLELGVFQKCHSLTSITIPNSVKSIGNGTFWN